MRIHPEFGFVVEYVRDIEASVRFHVEVMGLQVRRRHPRFVQFDTFAVASDAPERPGEPVELYWLVEDIERAHAAFASRTPIDVPLQDRPFGRMFGVRDPDGRLRYLLELARERPSVAT